MDLQYVGLLNEYSKVDCIIGSYALPARQLCTIIQAVVHYQKLLHTRSAEVSMAA